MPNYIGRGGDFVPVEASVVDVQRFVKSMGMRYYGHVATQTLAPSVTETSVGHIPCWDSNPGYVVFGPDNNINFIRYATNGQVYDWYYSYTCRSNNLDPVGNLRNTATVFRPPVNPTTSDYVSVDAITPVAGLGTNGKCYGFSGKVSDDVGNSSNAIVLGLTNDKPFAKDHTSVALYNGWGTPYTPFYIFAGLDDRMWYLCPLDSTGGNLGFTVSWSYQKDIRDGSMTSADVTNMWGSTHTWSSVFPTGGSVAGLEGPCFFTSWYSETPASQSSLIITDGFSINCSVVNQFVVGAEIKDSNAGYWHVMVLYRIKVQNGNDHQFINVLLSGEIAYAGYRLTADIPAAGTQVNITLDPDTGLMVIENPFEPDWTQLYGAAPPPGWTRKNWVPMSYTSDLTGEIVTVFPATQDYYWSNQCRIVRAKITQKDSGDWHASAYNVNKRALEAVTSKDCNFNSPSALGGRITGYQIVYNDFWNGHRASETFMVYSNAGTIKNAVFYTRDEASGVTQSYPRAAGQSAQTGYLPPSTRSVTEDSRRGCITVVTADQKTYVCGAAFHSDYRVSGIQYSTIMNNTDPIRGVGMPEWNDSEDITGCDPDDLVDLVTLMTKPDYGEDPSLSKVAVWFPMDAEGAQVVPGMPGFALTLTNTGSVNYAIVDKTGTGTELGPFTLVNSYGGISFGARADLGPDFFVDYSYAVQQQGMTVVSGDDGGYYVCCVSPWSFISADQEHVMTPWYAMYIDGTGVVVGTNSGTLDNSGLSSEIGYAEGQLGFFNAWRSASGPMDTGYGSRIVFYPFGAVNATNFSTMPSASPGTAIVLCAHETRRTDGWLVVNDDTGYVLDGQTGEMPPTTLDMTRNTIDYSDGTQLGQLGPCNFYLIKDKDNSITYRFSGNNNNVKNRGYKDFLFLWRIDYYPQAMDGVPDLSDVAGRTQLGGYQLSTKAYGGCAPVSYNGGYPIPGQTYTINWTFPNA